MDCIAYRGYRLPVRIRIINQSRCPYVRFHRLG